jgi:transposase
MQKVFLGGDCSKGYSDFIIIDEKKQTIEPNFQLDDTFEGHNSLYNVLQNLFEKYPDAICFAAVESTGSYENNWFNALKSFSRDLPIKVTRINPYATNHNNEAAMKRVTNDSISAYGIAEYQIHHPEKLNYEQDDEYRSVKRFLTALEMLTKTNTQLLNELETLIYTANPELLMYKRSKMPQWLLTLLYTYPDAATLAKASVEDLCKIPHVARTRAKSIIACAQQSVASASDDMTRIAIRTIITSITSQQKLIALNMLELQKRVQLPQIELLRTFKSIGVLSAIRILIEIGCIERFPTVKHLASFFGLHPVYKQSGDGTWGMHMSKKGRRRPRTTLFMVALNGIKNNLLIKDVFVRERQKGKVKMAALGVCMHKILRIIYAMLKNNTAFDPGIDRLNQERVFAKKGTKKNSDTKRRFQKEDAIAPISKKQARRRKEREMLSRPKKS